MKELFIRFAVCVFCDRLSIFVCASFPLFEGRMWDLLVKVPGHFLSYFVILYMLSALISCYCADVLRPR